MQEGGIVLLLTSRTQLSRIIDLFELKERKKKGWKKRDSFSFLYTFFKNI